MKYNEQHGNIFAVDRSYTRVHCVSEDAALGCGIAKQFVDVYGYGLKKFVKEEIHKNSLQYPCMVYYPYSNPPIINLVTKKFFYSKPSYDNLKETLVQAKDFCIKNDITKLAMPRIGSGRDQLDWEKIRSMIQDIFADTDIDIEVRVKE